MRIEGKPAPFDAARPFIMSAYLRGLVGYLRSRGVPVQPVLDVMQLTEDELSDPDQRIDHDLQDEIFRVAELVTGDSNVGLHAGEAAHLMHFGILGLLTMTCKTVRELVALHSRFQGLLTNGATVNYVARGDELVGMISFANGVPSSRQVPEYNLASHLTVARLMAGFGFSPTRIDLTYPEPADTSEQQRIFGCPTRFGCEEMCLYFPAFMLDLKLVVGDSTSRAVLEAEAQKRLDLLTRPLPEGSSEIAGLKQFVSSRLRGGPPSIDEAATGLGISMRTLQRRLETHQLTYRGVVDLARREMADRYLGDESLSQVDVALLLGFSNQSAFHRAFRRWFDTTPGNYRARQRRR